MSDSPSPHQVAPDVLGALENVLAEQLRLLRADDLDGMTDLCDRSDELLRQAAADPAISEVPPRRLERIAELHRQIVLAAAARKDEAAEGLAQLRRGKTLRRAYGQAGPIA